MYCIYIEARELASKLKRYGILNLILQTTGIFYKYLKLNFNVQRKSKLTPATFKECQYLAKKLIKIMKDFFFSKVISMPQRFMKATALKMYSIYCIKNDRI